MDHGGPAGYNYVYFDQYVAAGTDSPDEEAYRQVDREKFTKRLMRHAARLDGQLITQRTGRAGDPLVVKSVRLGCSIVT